MSADESGDFFFNQLADLLTMRLFDHRITAKQRAAFNLPEEALKARQRLRTLANINHGGRESF